MDDLLIRVVVRLAGIYDSLGRRAYQAAAHNALLGIARAAQAEAERRAGPSSTSAGGPVVPFPLDKARRTRDRDDGK